MKSFEKADNFWRCAPVLRRVPHLCWLKRMLTARKTVATTMPTLEMMHRMTYRVRLMLCRWRSCSVRSRGGPEPEDTQAQVQPA